MSNENHTLYNAASVVRRISPLSVTIVTHFSNKHARTWSEFRTARVSNIHVPVYGQRFKTSCVLCWLEIPRFPRTYPFAWPEISVFATRDPFPRKRVREIAGCSVSLGVLSERAALEGVRICPVWSLSRTKLLSYVLFFVYGTLISENVLNRKSRKKT